MWEPEGPLPPEIYRRRRVAAAALGLLVLIVVISVVAVSCSGGSDDAADAASAAARASSAKAVATQSAGSSGGSSDGSASPSSAASRTTGAAANREESAAGESAGGAGKAGESGGADSAAGADGSGAEEQTPGGQCTNASIAVEMAPEKPTYEMGDSVTFITTVTNTSGVSCVRDLSGPKIVDTVATVDGDRVWSNADCFPGTGSDIRTLQPGDKAHFKMVWAGTYSDNGCEPAQREPVPAGVYAATAHIGDKASEPVPFNIR